MIELLRQFGVGFATLLREFSSGIFALLGIAFGAWLSRRAELMRLRVERRTQIFDEACDLTAKYYVRTYGSLLPANLVIVEDSDNLMISVMCLDRKILTHFSANAYGAWRGVEKMIARKPSPTDTAAAFSDARASALNSLGNELR